MTNLTKTVYSRITSEENEEVERLAQRTSMSKSAFIRYCIVQTIGEFKAAESQDQDPAPEEK